MAKNNGLKMYGIVTSFIYELLGVSLLTVAAGLFLDNYFNTKGLFIIVLLMLGLASSFVNLYRRILKEGKKNEKK